MLRINGLGAETVRPQYPSLRQFHPLYGFSAASASPLKPLETKQFPGAAVDPTVGGFGPFSLLCAPFSPSAVHLADLVQS
jgi:hypothetical protein